MDTTALTATILLLLRTPQGQQKCLIRPPARPPRSVCDPCGPHFQAAAKPYIKPTYTSSYIRHSIRFDSFRLFLFVRVLDACIPFAIPFAIPITITITLIMAMDILMVSVSVVVLVTRYLRCSVITGLMMVKVMHIPIRRLVGHRRDRGLHRFYMVS